MFTAEDLLAIRVNERFVSGRTRIEALLWL